METIAKKPSILIVDDERINIHILKNALNGFNIKAATNGHEALRIAKSPEQPDLILLDIMMPEMDGFQVCKELKLNPQTGKIPVIFITAINDDNQEEKGLALGAVDYITKPFRLPIVQARIKNHLYLKKSLDILKDLSTLDFLTNIPNRRRFEEVLFLEWRHALRASKNLTLIILDIDFFKLFNDTYGHLAGDTCLKKIAKTLSNTMNRSTDFVARFGGEEFVVILPDTGSEGAINIAESFKNAIAELAIPHHSSPISDFVSVSMGIATCQPTVDFETEELIRLADKMLYQAKAKGRNLIKATTLTIPYS
ncbi:MAG: diguanylate cyclase [Deltaproteobacteria bacterium]|nr:diguanylate cyclase [Deltaproteobacteria bacterium]